MENHFTLDYARALDRADSLAPLRDRFYTVPGRIYMDGKRRSAVGYQRG